MWTYEKRLQCPVNITQTCPIKQGTIFPNLDMPFFKTGGVTNG